MKSLVFYRFVWRLGAAAILLGVTAGCATQPGAHPRDPLEPLNRGVYRFNDAVDTAVLQPLAQGYEAAVPGLLRTGVGNFFRNLGDFWAFVNNALQLKSQPALDSVVRVSVNTVFGLGGLLDVASEMGIERHRQDFGQTLAHYGVPSGPYLVLPFLGPSTARDTAALVADYEGDPVGHLSNVPMRNQLYALRVVNRRAQFLRAGDVLEQAALDKYSFTRDVWLQVRDNEAPARGEGSRSGDGAIENPDEPE